LTKADSIADTQMTAPRGGRRSTSGRRGGFDSFERLTELGGWGPPLEGFAQKGGGPVKIGKRGFVEVASQ